MLETNAKMKMEIVKKKHRRNSGKMGSTKGNPPTMNLENTFGMGSNSTLNPTMYNWNHIYFRYCDGGSFSGNRMDPIIQNNAKMYFRGKLILDALIRTLRNDYNFDKATDIVISGGSAGGLATFAHTNYIANMVDLKPTKIVSLPNVLILGMFLSRCISSYVSYILQTFFPPKYTINLLCFYIKNAKYI